ncbi:hypothetical protein PIB30_102586 [Stylosanthes scabra]|uniref:Uncharacterized protein n=1 Tax=Stylosanthes scabra TaxID=79078 RepID=A0ABU6QYI2_9FABA|nr:hypothetical protein [Stylosanthes scabra]
MDIKTYVRDKCSYFLCPLAIIDVANLKEILMELRIKPSWNFATYKVTPLATGPGSRLMPKILAEFRSFSTGKCTGSYQVIKVSKSYRLTRINGLIEDKRWKQAPRQEDESASFEDGLVS